ncbi:MAG TPA: hypothetical protein VJB60_00570 [Candidatus Peribacterales bacterium]|nr:hypothetical protein [Candidatus Peribacterales bacterium]
MLNETQLEELRLILSEIPSDFSSHVSFPRDYTLEELQRGDGMFMHPVAGVSFSEALRTNGAGDVAELVFDVKTGSYLYRAAPGWGWRRDRFALPLIGERAYKIGERIPSHWLFNPFVEPSITKSDKWYFDGDTGTIRLFDGVRDSITSIRFPAEPQQLMKFKHRCLHALSDV